MSSLYLLDHFLQDCHGLSLPTNCEMLHYYHHLHQVHTSRYSIRKSVSRCYELWEKAGISTSPMSYAIVQMKNLVSEYEESRKMWLHDRQEDFEFRGKLNELFFVGTEDALETCSDYARKLLVASLTMHLSSKVLDKIKRVKDEMNCKKIANVVEDYFKIVKDECDISFEASGDNTKLNVFDKIKRVKEELNCKKITIVVEDDFKLVNDECEISFEASEDKTKLKVDHNNNEYYSTYLFEEEWNTLYPNYAEQETYYFPAFHRSALGKLYCVYCCQTMTSDSEVRVDDISEFTCQQCFTVNFVRS